MKKYKILWKTIHCSTYSKVSTKSVKS